jgi:hypothetical protein
MGNFFTLGDYLDPIARIWGGGETNPAVFRHGREEAKKETGLPEIKEDAAEANKRNLPEDGQAK